MIYQYSSSAFVRNQSQVSSGLHPQRTSTRDPVRNQVTSVSKAVPQRCSSVLPSSAQAHQYGNQQSSSGQSYGTAMTSYAPEQSSQTQWTSPAPTATMGQSSSQSSFTGGKASVATAGPHSPPVRSRGGLTANPTHRDDGVGGSGPHGRHETEYVTYQPAQDVSHGSYTAHASVMPSGFGEGSANRVISDRNAWSGAQHGVVVASTNGTTTPDSSTSSAPTSKVTRQISMPTKILDRGSNGGVQVNVHPSQGADQKASDMGGKPPLPMAAAASANGAAGGGVQARGAQSYAPVSNGEYGGYPGQAGSRAAKRAVAANAYKSFQPTPTNGIYVHPSGEARQSAAPVTSAIPVRPAVASDHYGAKHHQSTPRDHLETKLTALEKIAYNDLQFVEHLGSGEFGQVYRGIYNGREVAIKQLYWDNTMLPEAVIQDLAKEIESFRHLRHKRLVCFIGACLEMPHPCLVTEYMPGGSLHHLLHVRKLRLPLLHCVNMCLQLSDGVMYLHSQDPCVVHRDLKSLNVVLDMNLNIKLCDFGLTESMDRTHITKKNNGGSPRYMAPELFDNKSKITEKVDVWAMGCIFIEIFGGPLPYEGINSLVELTREMLVNKRTPSIPAHIPLPLQEIIRSCCNFDHRLRPTSKQIFEHLKAVKKQLRAQGLI